MDALEEAVAAYQNDLTVEAIQWLIDRGISEEAADTFRLGVVGEPRPGHSRYQGWFAIPYLDKDGAPLSIRFRCLSQHDHREFQHGKYMSMYEEPTRIFNVRAIHEAGDTLHMTEGEFDAMILCQLGLPAIACPGAHSFTGHWRRMLAGFSRIWVWVDPDDAGSDMANKVTSRLSRARVIQPEIGDVTDTYLDGGEEAIFRLIERATR